MRIMSRGTDGQRVPALGRAVRAAAAVAIALAGAGFGIGTNPLPAGAAGPGGRAVAWGDDSRFQTEVASGGLAGVVAVEGGCRHSLALKSNGQVVAWGDDAYHQIDVPAAARSGIVTISAGCNHNLAFRSNRQLAAWGDNSFGQTNVPKLPSGYHWFTYSAGENFSVAVATNGSTQVGYAWGDGMDTSAVLPWPVKDIEACADADVMLKSDGTVYVGGKATAAMLAIPAGLSGVVAVDIGREHVVALKKNGTVVVWGANDYGQLNVPAGLSGVRAIAAGAYHTVALKSDGTVVAWGRNDKRQALVPAAPAGARYSAVGAGTLHSLAVLQPGLPGAPREVTAVASVGSAIVSWKPPAGDGGSALTGYEVTASGGQKCTTTGALECTVPDLGNGFSYTFTVRAANAVGTGVASTASDAVTPMAVFTPAPSPTSATPSATPQPTPTNTPSASPAPVSGETESGGDSALRAILGVVIVVSLAVLVTLGAFAAYGEIRRRRFGAVEAAAPKGDEPEPELPGQAATGSEEGPDSAR